MGPSDPFVALGTRNDGYLWVVFRQVHVIHHSSMAFLLWLHRARLNCISLFVGVCWPGTHSLPGVALDSICTLRLLKEFR